MRGFKQGGGGGFCIMGFCIMMKVPVSWRRGERGERSERRRVERRGERERGGKRKELKKATLRRRL
jgi:hypothetical protein